MIIGRGGKSIRNIMEKYKVDIRLPRAGDEDPSLVVVSGDQDACEDCIDHLKIMEEDFIQEAAEQDWERDYMKPTRQVENKESNKKKDGFMVSKARKEEVAQRKEEREKTASKDKKEKTKEKWAEGLNAEEDEKTEKKCEERKPLKNEDMAIKINNIESLTAVQPQKDCIKHPKIYFKTKKGVEKEDAVNLKQSSSQKNISKKIKKKKHQKNKSYSKQYRDIVKNTRIDENLEQLLEGGKKRTQRRLSEQFPFFQLFR